LQSTLKLPAPSAAVGKSHIDDESRATVVDDEDNTPGSLLAGMIIYCLFVAVYVLYIMCLFVSVLMLYHIS